MNNNTTLTFIRHDEAMHNALYKKMQQDPSYLVFAQAYDKNPESQETKYLAQKEYRRWMHEISDTQTPLVEDPQHRTTTMAQALKEMISFPDIIFVSPYLRTKQTLERMIIGWPELKNVPTIEEPRIQEQNVGTSFAYNDWRLFNVLFPEEWKKKVTGGRFTYRFPEGESIPDVMERTASLIKEITEKYEGKHILAITHHRALLALRANLEHLTPEQIQHIDDTDKPINSGVTNYLGTNDKQSPFTLHFYNKRFY